MLDWEAGRYEARVQRPQVTAAARAAAAAARGAAAATAKEAPTTARTTTPAATCGTASKVCAAGVGILESLKASCQKNRDRHIEK